MRSGSVYHSKLNIAVYGVNVKILIMTGPFYPQPGNNANLIAKLIPFLKKDHEVHILAPISPGQSVFLDELFGVPVHWAKDRRSKLKRKLVDPAVSKVLDRNGYSDFIHIQILEKALKLLRREYMYEAVIATTEPFSSALAAAKLSKIKKLLYIMDPPEIVRDGDGTAFRNRYLPVLLDNNEIILTTPFIRQALLDHGYGRIKEKIIPLGFPMIQNHGLSLIRKGDDRIRLLFCGWLYSTIRSPKFFLDIVSNLNDRFSVTFMGKECERLQERFAIKTRAELTTLPNQPYEVALQAMQDADILINIGNSVPVHMPSKTLEYINTGKPFVNFYKMKDCPTLYYTRRYPLCLNIYEGDDIEQASEKFVDFCFSMKGKTVDRTFIEEEYKDCTPRYIAQKILENLGD